MGYLPLRKPRERLAWDLLCYSRDEIISIRANGRRPMQTNFGPRHDFENFLLSEFNTMSATPAPAHDRFEAGVLIVNALADDLALDMAEVDIDDLI